MANQKHLDILKQGVEMWNQWRQKNPTMRPDLNGASLREVNLIRVNFRGANLREANFDKANLSEATLIGSVLANADLEHANLFRADLSSTDLSLASLIIADLTQANLCQASLVGVDLTRTILTGADFTGTDLSQAYVNLTVFGDVDLSKAKGLETIDHRGPSTIGIEAFYRSKGKIPEVFLRKTGVPESFITYIRSLAIEPISYSTCFISYSSKDAIFVTQLYADLQTNGVRCWFAPEDLKIGDKIRPRIDESIRIYDKLLLVLSEHSVTSNWVEHEVEMALAKEHKEKRTVLFPVRLDTVILEQEYDGWPALVRHERHIGDFTHWKDHDSYQTALNRLLRDLKADI